MKRMINAVDAAIGRELRDIRKQRRITQQELAERLGCTKSLVSFYESGKASISVPQFVKICDIYQVDYSELLKKVRVFIYGKI